MLVSGGPISSLPVSGEPIPPPSIISSPTPGSANPINVRFSRRIIYQSLAQPIFFIPPMDWFHQQPEPQFRPPLRLEQFVLAPFQTEAITLDKWYATQIIPSSRHRVTQPEAGVEPIFVLNVAAAQSWMHYIQLPQQVKPRQYVSQMQAFFDLSQDMDWFVEHPGAWTKKGLLEHPASFFVALTPVTLDMWWVESFNPNLRPKQVSYFLTEPITPEVIVPPFPCPYFPGSTDAPGIFDLSQDQQATFDGGADTSYTFDIRQDDQQSFTNKPDEQTGFGSAPDIC